MVATANRLGGGTKAGLENKLRVTLDLRAPDLTMRAYLGGRGGVSKSSKQMGSRQCRPWWPPRAYKSAGLLGFSAYPLLGSDSLRRLEVPASRISYPNTVPEYTVIVSGIVPTYCLSVADFFFRRCIARAVKSRRLHTVLRFTWKTHIVSATARTVPCSFLLVFLSSPLTNVFVSRYTCGWPGCTQKLFGHKNNIREHYFKQ